MNAIAHASTAPASGSQLDNRRVLAGLIDLAVIAAGVLVIGIAAGAANGGELDRSPSLAVIYLGWALYYYFACETTGGQTLGKRVMKLRVVRADGAPAGLGEIAVRTVLRVVDGIGLYLVGLVTMAATGQRRQRLGDLAGGTIVVDAGGSAPAVADHTPEAAGPAVPVATITLPAHGRAAASAPEPVEPAPAPEPVPLPEPLAEEPLAEEPLAEEPLAEEPALVPEAIAEPAPEPAVEIAPAPEEPAALPEPAELASPSLVELARDVAAAAQPADQDAAAEDEDEAEDPFTLHSVETVSAIDLVMGAEEEDDSSSDPVPPGA